MMSLWLYDRNSSQAKLDNNKILRLVKGDITERNVDVIVNAANSYLKHGGGVGSCHSKKRWSNHSGRKRQDRRRFCSGWFCSDY